MQTPYRSTPITTEVGVMGTTGMVKAIDTTKESECSTGIIIMGRITPDQVLTHIMEGVDREIKSRRIINKRIKDA